VRLLGKWTDEMREQFDKSKSVSLSTPEAAAANMLIQLLKAVRQTTPRKAPIVSSSMQEELEKLTPERLQEIIMAPGPGRPKKEVADGG
jgi:hypothetical protein